MYRDYFGLEGSLIYLDTASTGIVSINGARAAEDILEIMMLRGNLPYDEYNALLKETRINAAELLNAGENNIGIIPNTTAGVNIVKHTFPDIRHIIVYGRGFPCTGVPFLFDKKYRMEIQSSDMDVLKKNLKDFHRAIVFVDLVDFLTGKRQSLPEICRLVHKYDGIIAVDAIQALGSVPVDISKSEVDFLFAGSSKWLMGPQGSGIIYIADNHLRKTGEKCAGWLSLDYSNFETFKQLPDPRNEASVVENGTRNLMGIAMMNENIKLLLEIGIESVYEYNMTNARILLAQLEMMGEVSQSIRDFETPILSLKCRNSKKLLHYLTDRNIIVSYRNESIRFSNHIYNTREDIEAAVNLLKEYRI